MATLFSKKRKWHARTFPIVPPEDGTRILIRLKDGYSLTLKSMKSPIMDDGAAGRWRPGRGDSSNQTAADPKQYIIAQLQPPSSTPEEEEESVMAADWNERMSKLSTAGHRSAANLWAPIGVIFSIRTIDCPSSKKKTRLRCPSATSSRSCNCPSISCYPDGHRSSIYPKPDMGYMIQHEDEMKFSPTEQNQEELLVDNEAIRKRPKTSAASSSRRISCRRWYRKKLATSYPPSYPVTRPTQRKRLAIIPVSFL